MGIIRSNIATGFCLDTLNCGDLITDVAWNKIVNSIKSLQGIGTHGCEMPMMMINGVLRPAHGWSQGTVPLLDSLNPGYYTVDVTHPLPFFQDMNRLALTFDARLLDYIQGSGAYGERVRMEVEIFGVGYNGATQLLGAVYLPGTTVSYPSFVQAGGTLAAPGGSLTREIDGAWSPSLLPPAGSVWQGSVMLRLRITKSLYIYPNFTGLPSLVVPGALDWFGIRNIHLRHYKGC